jgi:hypothetical protein
MKDVDGGQEAVAAASAAADPSLVVTSRSSLAREETERKASPV